MSTIEEQKATHYITTAALIGVSFFLLTAIVSQVLRPDLGPAKNFLSEYALNSFGFVMRAGFAVLGVGIILLAIGLWRYEMTIRSGRLGVLVLAIAGVALLGVAAFPAEVDVVDPSITAQLHDLSALIHFLAVTISVLLISFGFRHDSRLRQHARTQVILAIAVLIAFLVFFTVLPMQMGSDPSVPQLRPVIGLFQRALIFSVWLWLMVTAARLRSLI